LASFHPADRPETPPPTMATRVLMISLGGGKPPSRKRWPRRAFMPSNSPGGKGGGPAGAQPASAAAPRVARNSRRLVKAAEGKTDRQLCPQPAKNTTRRSQHQHQRRARPLENESASVKRAQFSHRRRQQAHSQG